jgi:hypothetical protein
LFRNYTGDEYMEQLDPYFQKEWLKNQTASFNTYFVPTFSQVLTRRGYGITFNMLKATEMLNEELNLI